MSFFVPTLLCSAGAVCFVAECQCIPVLWSLPQRLVTTVAPQRWGSAWYSNKLQVPIASPLHVHAPPLVAVPEGLAEPVAVLEGVPEGVSEAATPVSRRAAP